MTAHDRYDPYDSPEDWLEQDPPEVSEDFVERTLRRVIDDHRRDRTIELAPEVLAAWKVPAPSPDFVTETLEAVLEELRYPGLRELLRRHAPFEPSADFVDRTASLVSRVVSKRLRRSLEEHRTPPPSHDFVQRTLDRLAHERNLAGRPRTTVRRIPWRAAVAALAAAVLLAVGLRLLGPRSPTPEGVPAALELGPTPVASALFLARAEAPETFTVGDALVLVASSAQEGE